MSSHRCFVCQSLFGMENTWTGLKSDSLLTSQPVHGRDGKFINKFINSSSKLCLSMLMTNLISFLFLILEMTVFSHHSYSSWILYELHFYSPTAWTIKHPPPTQIWLRTIKESTWKIHPIVSGVQKGPTVLKVHLLNKLTSC